MSGDGNELSADVIVIGGTPGGIAAAVTAARLGRSVIMTEYWPTIGAMATHGLGKSDIETREAIDGLFREFVERVHRHYIETYGANDPNVELCRDGYYYEPSVAERILDGMLAGQPGVTVLRNHRLESVRSENGRVDSVIVADRCDGTTRALRGRVFIDATYEGDLAAMAGAEYRVGREARSEFNELHAGVVYMDYETGTFLPGTTGEGDRRIQAYTYRLCLTSDPANSIVVERPHDYDRANYTGYLDDWRKGRMAPPREYRDGMGYYPPTFDTVVRALSIAELPNRKFDVNINPRPLGFPFCEENYAYPEADWPERERIMRRLRNLTLGLLYFLQNDEEIPAGQRELARRFNLARDEFSMSGGFPRQLYVREARRIVGEYTLSERDVFVESVLGRTPVHRDSIAAGEFPIDSFPVRKREPGQDVALEGYILMLNKLTHPYQIPYRIIVPRRINGLLVPVAASTTHVAFSTIRLEPTWMALGQAAGAAAHLALADGVELRDVGLPRLQRLLLSLGQVLTFFDDIDRSHPAYRGLQYFGTRGFFRDYHARADDPLDGATAVSWIGLALDEAAAEGARPALAGLPNVTFRQLAEVLPSDVRPFLLDGCADESAAVMRGDFCRALYLAGEDAATPREY